MPKDIIGSYILSWGYGVLIFILAKHISWSAIYVMNCKFFIAWIAGNLISSISSTENSVLFYFLILFQFHLIFQSDLLSIIKRPDIVKFLSMLL